MGKDHKAERAKTKVILRRIAREAIYYCRGLEKADSLIALGAAMELGGDYNSAIRNYTGAYEIAARVAESVEKFPEDSGGLAGLVADIMRAAQTGL